MFRMSAQKAASVQVIVTNACGSAEDVAAVRAVVQRGVAVIAACMGQDLQQLLANPELNPILGGTQHAEDASAPRCVRQSIKTI